MKLQKLRLQGFKSFADTTHIEFRDGVTAVVGSNGCGKSNIADAIRWVLGEQRASALRGSKMEEVIFNGTARRKPLNLADVSLLFSNEDGRVAIPQSEVEINRRVYREGGSEYALNRNPCRLRDIHALLRDTGLGANAYSIIEIGMIDLILSDRADERRALFEEASGIGGYKDRRQAALRRLEAAEADLARLEDLVGEVESKVRSLSRQKRRAERYAELRTRRLTLEVALASGQMERLGSGYLEGELRRSNLEVEEEAARAETSAAEAALEERRIALHQSLQARSAAAARLEAVRGRLDARERELLLSDERHAQALQRLEQIAGERTLEESRRAERAAEAAALATDLEAARAAAEEGRERVRVQGEASAGVRGRVTEAREAAARQAERNRAVLQEIATLEGERIARGQRLAEDQERLSGVAAREAELGEELARVGEQKELWDTQGDDLRERLQAAEEGLEEARGLVAQGRDEAAAAGEALRQASERLSRLEAQVAAREGVERSYEGFTPAVAGLLRDRRTQGVHGPLADYLSAEEGTEAAARIEAYLGPLLQAVVVDGAAQVEALSRWFREEWSGGGALYLLPLDGVPAEGELPPGVSARGAGAPWVRALLGGVRFGEALPLAAPHPTVTAAGDVLDGRGVVRLGGADAGAGILRRREELVELRAAREGAAAQRDEVEAARGAAAERLERLLAHERAAEEALQALREELRALEVESAAHAHRRERLVHEHRESGAALVATRERIAAGESRLAELERRLAELGSEVALAGGDGEEVREALRQLEAEWEEARDAESSARVELASLEGRLGETERRLEAAGRESAAAEQRLAALDDERRRLEGQIARLADSREGAAGEMQALFAERDEAAAALSGLEGGISGVEGEISGAEERARVARRRLGELADERHRLELEGADLRSRIDRLRERLEAEWARPWDLLVEAAGEVGPGDPESWARELPEVIAQIEGLGPINMLAVEEHAEEAQRLEFLVAQREDLVGARDDLTAAIRQINRTARELFMETFVAVRENFHRTFQSLFPGGECDVWLADEDDPLESVIEIRASPGGKRTQKIHLLSGGERTLTALALLFALYLVKPSPFCVLDEVDAPLDESNVGRFIKLLDDFKQGTQFVVITHNARTMESADWLYGVTMEEPGVSQMVSVELTGAWEADRVA
jgi:chromosome segregation protein